MRTHPLRCRLGRLDEGRWITALLSGYAPWPAGSPAGGPLCANGAALDAASRSSPKKSSRTFSRLLTRRWSSCMSQWAEGHMLRGADSAASHARKLAGEISRAGKLIARVVRTRQCKTLCRTIQLCSCQTTRHAAPGKVYSAPYSKPHRSPAGAPIAGKRLHAKHARRADGAAAAAAAALRRRARRQGLLQGAVQLRRMGVYRWRSHQRVQQRRIQRVRKPSWAGRVHVGARSTPGLLRITA